MHEHSCAGRHWRWRFIVRTKLSSDFRALVPKQHHSKKIHSANIQTQVSWIGSTEGFLCAKPSTSQIATTSFSILNFKNPIFRSESDSAAVASFLKKTSDFPGPGKKFSIFFASLELFVCLRWNRIPLKMTWYWNSFTDFLSTTERAETAETAETAERKAGRLRRKVRTELSIRQVTLERIKI